MIELFLLCTRLSRFSVTSLCAAKTFLPSDRVEHSFEIIHEVESSIVRVSNVGFIAALLLSQVLFNLAAHGRVPMVLNGIVSSASGKISVRLVWIMV